jgi:biotin carboxyl carrier protein
VVAADADRVPLRELAGTELEDVRDEPHRGARREDVGPARDVLLQDVVLRRPGDARPGDPLAFRRRHVEGEEDRGGRVDRHRGAHLAQRDPREEGLHVDERGDRDPDPSDLPLGLGGVGVVAHLGRQVEGDREPGLALLEQVDAYRGIIVRTREGRVSRTAVQLGPPTRDASGALVREVVVGGWRFELLVESERRAVLRERSRRGGGAAASGGPLELRAIIPGRIVAVSVGVGDAVTAGQQLLVLEAMKMQNELRAPREGTVVSVAVAVGAAVEVGDVLMVVE